MSLPTTSLKKLTLYKNSLAFTERTAKLADGAKAATGAKASPQQRSFRLDVPNSQRELTMATMSVNAGSCGVMVAHDAPGSSKSHSAVAKLPYEFQLGAGVGLGNFLASVIGAQVKVSMGDGSARAGQVLLVEEKQRTVPGSDTVVESVYSDLQLLSDEGEVMRVSLGEMTSVQVPPRMSPAALNTPPPLRSSGGWGACELRGHAGRVQVCDPALRKELNQALQAQLQRRRPKPPPSNNTELRITAMTKDGGGGGAEEEDDGAELRVSYAAPTKEWLCSYRLDVPSDHDSSTSLHHFAQVRPTPSHPATALTGRRAVTKPAPSRPLGPGLQHRLPSACAAMRRCRTWARRTGAASSSAWWPTSCSFSRPSSSRPPRARSPHARLLPPPAGATAAAAAAAATAG